ncbi:hypothetical protein FRC0141_01301 [Corynebacterium diphtheriae]|nr:hypothetical protein NG01_05510 [Corynebacterium diphtheriae]KLN44321.1 hypothetical protein AL09_05925 [Corynebacterium diphtheriae bv. gravis str. ISS 4749]ODS16340.1 hypothetical protein BGK43_08725 [Corynebacterium diphtheriae]ODS16530.1 hypothetical protein BGK40_06950 [Corynebacterium diphtheriae]OIS21739.1 hypothetical protein BHF95_06975 [Corynebacterium diphtheriae]
MRNILSDLVRSGLFRSGVPSFSKCTYIRSDLQMFFCPHVMTFHNEKNQIWGWITEQMLLNFALCPFMTGDLLIIYPVLEV